MQKIPFYLLTGYLGSGKTSLLKHILNLHRESRKIGIVQNEFAPSSVDGLDLRQTGESFEILEVNNGSVFCVCLLGSFIKSLGDFIDACQPDIVLMEASGLSDPISIAEMLQETELSKKIYLAHTWCIVDASRFHKLARNLPRIQHQVRVADTVLVNKCDLVSTDLEELRSWVKALNPFASLVETVHCSLDIDLDPAASAFKMAPVAMRKAQDHARFENSGRPDMASCVIKSTRAISRKNLNTFLEEVAPETYRIKGFVKLDTHEMLAVQSCFGETELKTVTNYTGPTELVGMGPGVDHLIFGRRFRKFLH
ncbi:MAG: CobW family GTP-binding protein [Bacteroidota bacterium]